MPISVGMPGPSAPDVQELRLGLVCYGGVSLAVYMHGVTRELQSLVNASHAFAVGGAEDADPFQGTAGTEKVYWQALRQSQGADGTSRTRTRVVIDVIAGTSAGGINGVVLAKALACRATQRGLRDVWLKQGDIARLLRAPWIRLVPVPLRALVLALITALRMRPALDGDFLLRQVFQALRRMKPDSEPNARAVRWPVELHVTLTDFFGYPVQAPAWDPKRVPDLRHRHELAFSSERDGFSAGHDAALAFAARATSSFPGAFPPVQIGDLDQLSVDEEGRKLFLAEHWRPPDFSRHAEKTAFVDGGVLDNAPFDLAIQAIWKRPADTRVDRRLLYIEPDPQQLACAAVGTPPDLVRTVWGGLSTIPRYEPVLEDLLEIQAHNDRVAEVTDVIEAIHAEVTKQVPKPAPAPAGLPDYDRCAREATHGPGELAYHRLKLDTVIDRMAQLVCELAKFPPESNHAQFVHGVLGEWAHTQGLEPRTEELTRFLDAFDLPYRERRLRFVIHRLNELYAREAPRPCRTQLGALKRALYARARTLTEIERDVTAKAANAVRELFDPEKVGDWLADPRDPDAVVKAFLEEEGVGLDDLRRDLEAYLRGRLDGFSRDTYATICRLTDTWAKEQDATDVRGRYADFAIWDALLLPVVTFSDIKELAELKVLRISPLDSHLLRFKGAHKLQGVGTHHFGAFFKRSRRENDYLWGRLDAVERLTWLLVGNAPSAAYRQGFRAVLAQERWALWRVWRLQLRLWWQLLRMRGEQVSRRREEPVASN